MTPGDCTLRSRDESDTLTKTGRPRAIAMERGFQVRDRAKPARPNVSLHRFRREPLTLEDFRMHTDDQSFRLSPQGNRSPKILRQPLRYPLRAWYSQVFPELDQKTAGLSALSPAIVTEIT